MKGFRLAAGLIALVVAFNLTIKEAYADDAELLKRVEALEQELKILKHELELRKQDDEKKKADLPVITASAKDGFSIKSPDDQFKLKIRGLLQADSRFYLDNKKESGTSSDTFIVRRARPIFEGTVYKDFGFFIMPELGGGSLSLVDGYVDYLHSAEFKIRAGKFKEPFQLERLQSVAAVNFVELGLPTNLSPNRDVGAQISGDFWNGALSYQAGVFNGSPDQGSVASTDVDTNNDKDAAFRIFAQPFKNGDSGPLRGLGFGAAMTIGHQEAGSIPTYRSPAQASVFTFNSGVTADGTHQRFSPQGYWYWNQFGILAEYVASVQELVRSGAREKFFSDAWQISGSYVLTGEDASFGGVKPRKPFDLSQNQWGAWEIAGRYGNLDLDNAYFDKNFASPDNSILSETAYGVGLNWYLNNNVRVMLDYERTDFDGGAVGGDRASENALLSRFQITY